MELLPDAGNFGLLKTIDLIFFLEKISGVILNFDKIDGYKNRILITLDNEFDEIKINLVDDNFDEKVFFAEDILFYREETILVKNAFSEFNNFSLIWFWKLENNQGYNDAFQFEFRDEIKETLHKIQFFVIGSRIEIYFLNKIK